MKKLVFLVLILCMLQGTYSMYQNSVQNSPNKAHQLGLELLNAIENGDSKIALEKIAVGANVNYPGSAIMLAAEKGYIDVMKALLEAGANVNERDSCDFTVLFNTVLQGSNEASIWLLLAAGADPNIENDAGLTVLDWLQDREELRTKIVKARADFLQYEKDQPAAHKVIAQEVTHIEPLVDIISGYAYNPHDPNDLPETQQEKKEIEIKENTESVALSTKKHWCFVQ